MARIRTIKPEFFTSPDTARVSHAARLLYIAMWSWADDYGRGEMNLLQLRAFAFPESDKWLDSELHSVGKEFQSLCKEVVNGFNLTVYTHRGRTFYEIPSWDDHQKTQRKANSKYPTSKDPESTPDQRFHNSEGISESTQGNSESTQGKNTPGTGEESNRGTGLINPQTAPHQQPTNPTTAQPDTKAIEEALDHFTEFWEHYPRKQDKQAALKEFAAQIETTDPQAIIAGAARLATDPNLPEKRFIPYAETWLHNQRWKDEDPYPYQPTPWTDTDRNTFLDSLTHFPSFQAENDF